MLSDIAGTTYNGLVHISDWVRDKCYRAATDVVSKLRLCTVWTQYPTSLVLAGGSPSPILDGYNIWSAVLTRSVSPRTELLHEIDPLAYPRYTCSGPGNGVNATWHLPPRAGFTRAALTAVINGTQWKLLVGDCAGWDTNSSNVPPPGYHPDPTKPADREALGPEPGNTTCNHRGAEAFAPGDPPQTYDHLKHSFLV